MHFVRIVDVTPQSAHNKFIEMMNQRGSYMYSQFNDYSQTNPKRVFPIIPVAWNAGYTTMVLINGKYIGYPVFRNQFIQFFVGMCPESKVCYVFHSKTRKRSMSDMKLWAAIAPYLHIKFDENQFAQKFSLNMDDARYVLNMIFVQAVRTFSCKSATTANILLEFNNHLENHPRYAAQFARRKKQLAEGRQTAVAEINSTPTASGGKFETYIFTTGSRKLGEYRYLNDADARTAATKILMKAIANDELPFDAVVHISRTTVIGSVKISVQ
jgi:hypothetical protein